MVLFIMFVILSTALITYMPSEIYETGYQSPHYFIPNEFDAWDYVDHDYYIEDTLNTGTKTLYDFSSAFNETLKVRAKWKYGLFAYDDTIIFETITSQFLFGYFVGALEPVVNKQMLIANWDSDVNMSMVKIRNNKNSFEAYFKDTNVTRNEIDSSWEEGSLNCTISVPKGYLNYQQETLGAREIVFSILTFRLSSVYASVSPLLGFAIASIFYVPIAFIFYYLVVHFLHGGS